jgi:hypothetical protein
MKFSTSVKPLTVSMLTFTISLGALLWLASILPYQWAYISRFLVVFPAIWVGYETTRAIGNLDELQQRIALETLAFSLANTALVTLAIGLLQISGSDGINALWVLPLFVIFGGIGLWLARRRYQ